MKSNLFLKKKTKGKPIIYDYRNRGMKNKRRKCNNVRIDITII